jgi:hypothetical protein
MDRFNSYKIFKDTAAISRHCFVLFCSKRLVITSTIPTIRLGRNVVIYCTNIWHNKAEKGLFFTLPCRFMCSVDAIELSKLSGR